MTKIINLTQHNATAEQAVVGVFNIGDTELNTAVKQLLTFNTIEEASAESMEARAEKLATIAAKCGADAAMIGGAPYFMSALERALKVSGIKPLYAFSVRESREVTNPDGSVTKTNVFKHVGFVEA